MQHPCQLGICSWTPSVDWNGKAPEFSKVRKQSLLWSWELKELSMLSKCVEHCIIISHEISSVFLFRVAQSVSVS